MADGVVRTGMENTPKYRPNLSPVFSANAPRLFDAGRRPLYHTDWQEEATRTARPEHKKKRQDWDHVFQSCYI
jgi:hypothetical protein